MEVADGCCCVRCVRTKQVAIVEDLGQFKRFLSSGLHFLFYPLQDIVGTLSLRIQQLDVVCETKTKDNVFIHVNVAVQYCVIENKAYEAFYRLTGTWFAVLPGLTWPVLPNALPFH
jgi:regulator of protease activity HflC (stomatin/prohibitin superfamily)